MHPKVLKIAILKNLVDNPDARKLQRNPVPVMGGIAVFFGIAIGNSIELLYQPSEQEAIECFKKTVIFPNPT